MKTINATNLRKNLFENLENVVSFNDTMIVTTKKGNAIVMSEEDYNCLMETIYLVSKPGVIQKIKDGEKEDPSKMAQYDDEEDW